ncbi:hypothetical protein SAMN02745121_05350 [Nannocystis exedens]|uniref:Uncharacterized protein n=1 Tax=Nannocystis exedens TaxID=54 RepID=A0A1I2CZ43_9BACT|nr:hypothetical protein [Nannocystis exedens]PCC68674.1 hypothetical protein NAEX_01691 [Nannocystis exedens]SFE73548.1 hypothetical protein SAMN02745121_05350 [Nannocystis exedens]
MHEDGTPFRDRGDGPLFDLHAGQPPSGAVLGIHKPDGQLTWVAVNRSRCPPSPTARAR